MLIAPFSLRIARNPTCLRLLHPVSAARATRLAMSTSVEYAKSGRSTCKGCSGAIASGALRLCASARDPRGFDTTKWYHLSCLPSSSHPLGPIESIKGFDSIKDDDREELLRELEKNRKRDNTAVSPLGEEEPSPKKARIQMSSPAEGVPDNVTVSVEYAKSGCSTCKGCSENVAKGALCLGASFLDPRGFENNKWYHVACFPTSSYPSFRMENLKGFDSIEDHDRDKLRTLEENQKSDGSAADVLNESNLKKEMAHSMVDSKQGAEKDLEGIKNHKRDDTAVSLEEPSLKKARIQISSPAEGVPDKLLAGNSTSGPLISFSVSKIKKVYKDATLPAHWKVFDTVIFREQEDGLHASSKIAAFDFDGCLAKTNVRRVGADQWSLQHKSIPEKLQGLYNDGYKLVIFTNESNIERHKNKRQQAVDSKVGRLDNFIECVKAPIQVFIACGLGKGKDIPDDPYRKPNPGMWRLMAQHFNSGIQIDMDRSFYVGDAAGREKDHSDADIKFAKAVGLKFHVPEEYFGC